MYRVSKLLNIVLQITLQIPKNFKTRVQIFDKAYKNTEIILY